MISYSVGGGRVILQTAFRTEPWSSILLEREQRPRLMESSHLALKFYSPRKRATFTPDGIFDERFRLAEFDVPLQFQIRTALEPYLDLQSSI
jgi:hypothetical protein